MYVYQQAQNDTRRESALTARSVAIERLLFAYSIIDDYITDDIKDTDGYHIACEAYDVEHESAIRHGLNASDIAGLIANWHKQRETRR